MNKNNPKLSIVMPVYNESHLTQEAILNIINVCKNIDYELLIMDDASKDDTYSIITSLLPLGEGRIKYYKADKNVGVTKSWNNGVDLAEGAYIVVINNDVIFPDGFFEEMMDGFGEGIGITNPRFTEGNPKDPSPVMYFSKTLNGFCYMFKQEDKNKLFPLDESMRIFGSDNWLYYHMKDQGLKVKVIRDAICHHLKSQTVFHIPNEDRPIFLAIAEKKGRVIEDVYPLPTNDPGYDFTY